MQNTIADIAEQMQRVIIGKREVVEKVLMAVLADGHVLLDDVPGVGKTTLAVALGKVLGLTYHRIQFTPDVLPSDIVGFSMYDKDSGRFRYMPGIVNSTNLLLAEEIIRGSVEDGKSYILPANGATRAEVATVLMRFVEMVKGA